MSEFRLFEEITSLSQNTLWDDVKLEWHVTKIIKQDELELFIPLI